ncbi:MetS family NSS transporter small subunit [bacterium]|nr:MetS family NSS transporter small subunit [bacterium]
MSTISIISMVCILGFVLGGFVYFLSLAIRREREKSGE